MQIVVDTSALLAVLFGEPDRVEFHEALLNHRAVMSVVSSPRRCSCSKAVAAPPRSSDLDRAIARYEITAQGVSPEDLALLRHALLRFGKGRRRPPAVLNFGDLFAYALAKRLGLPLLFKGDDFARTDVRPALG